MKKPLSKLNEIKRLHKLGFAVHLLKPNSKVPVNSGWTSGPRTPLKKLLSDYSKGNNIGVRLGSASVIDNCYLAAIDVDVKGGEKRHQKQALKWLDESFPGLVKEMPKTLSGRGNGSMHLWLLVEEPLESKALYSSNEEVEVFMPTAKPTQRQIEILGEKKIKEGFRLRPAFEIDFMCEGRQVVLPPSIHPDTAKEYKWSRPIEDSLSIPVISIKKFIDDISSKKKSNKFGGKSKTSMSKKLKITDVEEGELINRLEPEVVAGIFDGDDVEDRSAFCFSVALYMVRAKFKTSEILGVLTNRDYFIGSVAFEHSKSSNRNRAAHWAYNYCVSKAKSEADAREAFNCEVVVYDKLPKDEAIRQVKEIQKVVKEKDWKKKLDRTDNDKIKPTFKNIKLILQNVVAHDVFLFDEFSKHQVYGVDTPWGGVKGVKLDDTDEIKIKDWFSRSGFKIEPHTNLIAEVITQICSKNSFHPVKQYLEGLEWDNEPRLDTWLQDYLGAVGNEVYLKAVSRKFLTAAVARIYEPGKKFDFMPIFEGFQGVGKSTVGKILASKKWFYDSDLNLHDKDSALNLQGQWFIEMAELANLSRSDVRTIKSYVVREVDKVRPPYGKRMVEIARQCVFFGTTNDKSYLKDKTGNRRFLPIEVTDVDIEGLKDVRDQLWAEAMLSYELGEDLYFTKEENKIANKIQETRVLEDISDVMHSKLVDWIKEVRKQNESLKVSNHTKLDRFVRFRINDLFGDFQSDELGENILPPLRDFKSDNLHFQWAAHALRKAGFEKYALKGLSWWRFQECHLLKKKK